VRVKSDSGGGETFGGHDLLVGEKWQNERGWSMKNQRRGRSKAGVGR